MLERPCALRIIVLSSISTCGTGHRGTGGILHNWRARFSFCWPQCLYKKDLHDWLEEKNICTLYIGKIVQEQLILAKILLWNAAKSSGYVVICHANASLWGVPSRHVACDSGKQSGTFFSQQDTADSIINAAWTPGVPGFPPPWAFPGIGCVAVARPAAWYLQVEHMGYLFRARLTWRASSHFMDICVNWASILSHSFLLIAACILDSQSSALCVIENQVLLSLLLSHRTYLWNLPTSGMMLII